MKNLHHLAAIDLGANSTRLYICAVSDNHLSQPLLKQTVITRLGEDVAQTKKLNSQAIKRTLKVLTAYKEQLTKFKVKKFLAVGTSALREAANAADFLAQAEQILKQRPQVISGQKEAELTFFGATFEQSSGPFLVIDIGGGSTELVYGDKQKIYFSTSLLLGCISLAEMFLVSDPPTKTEIAQANAFAMKTLKANLPPIRPGTKSIAVAGTPTSLVAIRDKIYPYNSEKVHGQTLTKKEIEQLLQTLSALPLKERKKVVGLEPQRAEVIISGIIILLAVLNSLNIGSIIVSERDILDGIIFSLINLAQTS